MSTPPVWVPSWQHEDVEVEKTNLSYQGFYTVQQLHLRYKCFSGEWSPWLKREQVYHCDAAAVLLVDLSQRKLVLVEQFRMGLLGSPTSPWLLEIVAGLIDPGEKPEEAAIRETQEEANCQILQLFPIGASYNSPGGLTEKTYLFCGIVDAAKVGDATGVGQDHHSEAEHEDIRVHVLDLDAVLASLQNGSFLTSSSTVIALQWLALNMKNGHLEQKMLIG